MSTATVTTYKYSVAGHLSFAALKCEKPRNQAVSGLIVDIGLVSTITFRQIPVVVQLDSPAAYERMRTQRRDEEKQRFLKNSALFGVDNTNFVVMLASMNCRLCTRIVFLIDTIDALQVQNDDNLTALKAKLLQ